jgi:small nuclear ribonucleoprotein (snRNP)-like protein
MLVELKNGETLNGHLVLCDTWMNLTLREVVQTSPVRLSPARRRHKGFADLEDRRATSSCGCRRCMSRGIMCVLVYL